MSSDNLEIIKQALTDLSSTSLNLTEQPSNAQPTIEKTTSSEIKDGLITHQDISITNVKPRDPLLNLRNKIAFIYSRVFPTHKVTSRTNTFVPSSFHMSGNDYFYNLPEFTLDLPFTINN